MTRAAAPRKRPTAPAKGALTLPPGVRLTHPERVVYRDQGITKGDLATYYMLVADRMLPHIVDRPITMVRCPEGQAGQCFFQKHPPLGMDKFITPVRIREGTGNNPYATVQDIKGLLSLVQFGALEIHTWGSRAPDIERPDRLVFDLDPAPDVAWKRVVAAALMLKDLFRQLKLKSFVKTTGGKGIHVVVPIEPEHPWPTMKAFCRSIAETVAAEHPSEFLVVMSKAKRQGKIFIDYLRNDRGATAVAPYSTRSRPGAPVSMPLDWKELTSVKKADAFNVADMAARLKSRRADPWKEMNRVTQRLSPKWLRGSAK